MGILRIESCLDRPARFKEDGLVIVDAEPTIIAVCDGFSVPYDQENLPILVGGLGTGEVVRQCFCRNITAAKDIELVDAIREIDGLIKMFHEQLGKSHQLAQEPAYFSGLTFATAKIDLLNTDCDNPVKKASIRDRALKEQLQKQYGKERYRTFFTPLMMAQKNRDINNPESIEGYPALNGKLSIGMCHYLSLPINILDFLLLCTDGFLPFDWFNEPEKMRELANIVQKRGVHDQLWRIRDSGQTAEAAAVAVWFD